VIEIRFHGRGGQGSVVASELLAQAAFLDGKRPQSFPFFGVERRGAPVTAFARIDDRPIRLRTSVTNPDLVVVLDPGLLRAVAVTEGLRDGGMLIANSRLAPERLSVSGRTRVATVDARAIALRHGLGSATLPIVNTVMLGALARASGVVSLSAVERAIEQFVPARPVENREAAREGYDSVRVGLGQAPTGPVPTRAPSAVAPLPDGPVASVSSEVLHTSAWRSLVPVIHLDRCTRCNFCWKFCPDHAIRLGADGFPVLRPEYCKGCGICAEECPPRTIEMVAEEALG
jgi:2-oxoacid:acceptor oxidoreductase gamma subunit (pyruvate/2-ketoisovalerate family)/2-oxoacid:acceptor oxidoreductase delta subunit (pyruvate/2-ketoisovalerate family)